MVRHTVKFSGIKFGGIVVVALLLLSPACSSDSSEDGAETSLANGFLDPLDDNKLAYEVTSVCHYQRDSDGAWHFAVHITIDADMATTSAALASTVDIIDDRRPSAIVQQHAGKPDEGWTGQLTDNGDTAILDLVKNNLSIDGRPGVGWQPVCPESVGG